MNKVILLTSGELRHKYIANKLNENIGLSLIINEQKSKKIKSVSDVVIEDDKVLIKNHFEQREQSEKLFFGNFNKFPEDIPLMYTPHNTINSEQIFNLINSFNPDYLVLFGTSIIKNPLLKHFENKIINIHLGLSPYYKGSATNLFPFYNNELSCVGCTIHLVNEKVDEGDILHQFRPDISKEDSIYDIGNKVIAIAGELISILIEKYDSKKIKPVKQNSSNGKIYRIRDFNVQILKKIFGNLQNGIIKEYIENKRDYDKNYPIINNI